MGSQVSSLGSQSSSMSYSPYPSSAYTPASHEPSAAVSFDEEAAAMVDAAAAAYAETAGHVSGSDEDEEAPGQAELGAKSSLFASTMYEMMVRGARSSRLPSLTFA